MALVRMFSHRMGLPLVKSYELAREAMRYPEETKEARLGDLSDYAVITVDLARFHSWHNATVSAALNLAGPRKRGRRPNLERKVASGSSSVHERPAHETVWDVLARAEAYGVDLSALRAGLTDSPAVRLQRLEENSRFVAAMRRNRAAR